MNTWIKIFYKDGWFPEGSTCILTGAEASGRWAGEKYAIFDLEERPHVAFWPMSPTILKAEPVSKEEARKIMWRAVNGASLETDYRKTYEKESG